MKQLKLTLLAVLMLIMIATAHSQAIHYDVPYISQISYGNNAGFPDWGQSACGPTTIAMLLKYYYPNSGIGVPEVYAAATQTLTYNGPLEGYRNVGFPPVPPAQTWQNTVSNTGLTNVPVQFRPYFGGQDDGMDPIYAAKYLSHAWGAMAQVRTISIADVIAELANGPVIMNVNETDRAGKRWGGHYVVITGYDTTTSTFTINDPFPPFAAYYGNAPANERISQATLTAWYQGRILTFHPDTTLSTNGRKYTNTVDNSVNNDGISPNCTPSTDCFTVDTISGKTSVGQYTWQEHHSAGIDYAFAVEAGHNVRWKPSLTASGYYEVVIRTYAAPKSGSSRYSLHDNRGQELATRYVDQNDNAATERVASLGTVFLSNGAYVDATMATNAPADIVGFLYRDYPSTLAKPSPGFTASANGNTGASNQSIVFYTPNATPLSVSLNASASQPGAGAGITGYEWILDGIKIGTGVAPNLTLTTGMHTIALQVTNTNNLAAIASAIISVTAATSPTAAFTFAAAGKTGVNNQSVQFNTAPGTPLPITFNGTPSQAGTGSLTYLWQTNTATLSTQPTFTANFSAGTTTTVTLRVTNTARLTASASAVIVITQTAPANGSVSATPNPCTITVVGGTCGLTLQWNTSGVSAARVFVKDANNVEQQLFTTLSGAQWLSWIQASPQHYIFEIFDYSRGSRGAILSSVQVMVPAPAPTPIIIQSISPTSPVHGPSNQTVDMLGSGYAPGATATINWGTGGTTLSGTQIVYLNSGHLQMKATFGNAGTWTIVVNSQGRQSAPYRFTVR